MKSAHASDTSLASLVDRFVVFLQDQWQPAETPNSGELPGDLASIYDVFGHHLVALALVAKSDDKIVPKEREAIMLYCMERIRDSGHELSAAEEEALDEHVRNFRPLEMHLGRALDRLRQDSKPEIAALIAAAHAVVEADGVVRLQEALFLKSLLQDLTAP